VRSPIVVGLLGAAVACLLVLSVVLHERGVTAPGGMYVHKFRSRDNPPLGGAGQG
jgi:hypothetical protein